MRPVRNIFIPVMFLTPSIVFTTGVSLHKQSILTEQETKRSAIPSVSLVETPKTLYLTFTPSG